MAVWFLKNSKKYIVCPKKLRTETITVRVFAYNYIWYSSSPMKTVQLVIWLYRRPGLHWFIMCLMHNNNLQIITDFSSIVRVAVKFPFGGPYDYAKNNKTIIASYGFLFPSMPRKFKHICIISTRLQPMPWAHNNDRFLPNNTLEWIIPSSTFETFFSC